MICSKCGIENAKGAGTCKSCGNALHIQEIDVNNLDVSGLKIVDEEVSGDDIYRTIIGPKNTDYYHNKFEHFDAGGSSISWHWPAFFITFFWLLYRKMWGLALVYFLLPIPMQLAEVIPGVTNMHMLAVMVVYLLLVFIAVPMYANKLYYNHIKAKIKEIDKKHSQKDKTKHTAALMAAGGTSSIVIIIILFFVIVTVIGIIAAIAIPSYQGYVSKAKGSRITEITTIARTGIENYAIKNKIWPRSERDIDFDIPVEMIGVVDLIIVNGVIELGVHEEPGKTARFIPSVNDKGYIVWKCEHGNIGPEYLPPGCYK